MMHWRYRLMTRLGGHLRRVGQWLLDEADFNPSDQEKARIRRLIRENGQLTRGPGMRVWGCQHMSVSSTSATAPTCPLCGAPMQRLPVNSTAVA